MGRRQGTAGCAACGGWYFPCLPPSASAFTLTLSLRIFARTRSDTWFTASPINQPSMVDDMKRLLYQGEPASTLRCVCLLALSVRDWVGEVTHNDAT